MTLAQVVRKRFSALLLCFHMVAERVARSEKLEAMADPGLSTPVPEDEDDEACLAPVVPRTGNNRQHNPLELLLQLEDPPRSSDLTLNSSR